MTDNAIARRTFTFWDLTDVRLRIISKLISKLIEPPEQIAIVPAHESGAVVHWVSFSDYLFVFKIPGKSRTFFRFGQIWINQAIAFDLNEVVNGQIFEFYDLQKPLPIIHDVEHSKGEETWIDPKSHLVGGVAALVS